MRVVVVGAGYVGLVTSACLAAQGNQVVCVDSDAQRVALLRRGEIPIFERGLGLVIAAGVRSGTLSFETELVGPVAFADIVFIAVGTPSLPAGGGADLSSVFAVAKVVAQAASGFTVVVTKSTVPVGTGDEIAHLISVANPRADIAVASNPEFLREGSAIEDFLRPERIVVGCRDDRARGALKALYRSAVEGGAVLLETDLRGAELIKYASNGFLAMKVSFINEIADLCEQVGADIDDVSRGVGLDSRIGEKFLRPGPGFGGSCFPKDTTALAKFARDFGSPLKLIETTIAVNGQRKTAMGHKVIAACEGGVRGRRIGVLGLTFKAGTDDIRDSPSLTIVEMLITEGASVVLFDPKGMATAKRLLPEASFVSDPYEVASGSDCLVLATEWEAFRELDLIRIRDLMRTPNLVDVRNFYPRSDVEAAGLKYTGIGRVTPRSEASLTYAAE